MIFFNVPLLTFNTEQCNFITNNRLPFKMQQNLRKAPLNLFSKNKAWVVGGKTAAKCSGPPTHWAVQWKFFVILIHVWPLSSKLLLDLKPTTSTRYVIPWVNKCTLLLKVSLISQTIHLFNDVVRKIEIPVMVSGFNRRLILSS